jgi:hypothetical protein
LVQGVITRIKKIGEHKLASSAARDRFPGRIEQQEGRVCKQNGDYMQNRTRSCIKLGSSTLLLICKSMSK